MEAQPILGITVGDPSGIGPEITVKALLNHVWNGLRPLVFGDPVIIQRAIRVSNLESKARIHVVHQVEESIFDDGIINVFDIGIISNPDQIAWGKVQAISGKSAISAIEAATSAALSGKIDGIVTAPINKEAIWAAGSTFLGHTEMLGDLCGATETNTMFVVKGLKIFFATRHMSLGDAVASIDKELIDESISKSAKALRVFGSERAKLAVAALNPHGGEGGHFGREEIDVLRPCVEEAIARGLNVVGPIPADAVFHQGVMGAYDGVLSLYHDQGHIASKTLDFDGTVSVTVGLPILRTSVDHGTAFDIAGSGKASSKTMESAIDVALDLAKFVPEIRRVYATSKLSA
jgi:4-hydroxythreonine-4-phosphate dehydrogenase